MNMGSSDEPKPSVAPVKVDNQSYAFLLLRYLQRMDPRSYRYFLHELLVIFFTVDVMLYPRLIDWLKRDFGLDGARNIVSHSIKTWRTLPLHFEETVSHGWVVSCRSGGLKGPVEADKEDGSDDEDESDQDDGAEEAFVEEVQAVTEDGLVDGYLLSQIREGDLIQFNSHSTLWWSIYEFRPRKKTILLSRDRTVQGAAAPLDTQGDEAGMTHKIEVEGVALDDENDNCNGNGNDDDTVQGSARATARQFSTRVVTEYKEVRIHALFGALVRREGILTAKTIEGLERDANCNFDFALLSYAAAEEYNAQLVEATALKKAAGPRKTLKKKDQFDDDPATNETRESKESDSAAATKSKKKKYTDRRVVVMFKMPLPCVAAAADRMKELAESYPVPSETEEERSKLPGATNFPHKALIKDPIWHMQHQAQIKVWVTRWEENLRARQLLGGIDPYLCLHRDKWLLICKVLRVVSRGGDTLLPDFINWTKKAGNDGVKRSKDAGAAWASVRPVTTCDLQALATARAYLRQRGAGHKKSYFDSDGRLRPEAMDTDPRARVVLDAAALYMQGRVLTFFDQSLLATKPKVEVEADIDGSASVASCAVYEYDLAMYKEMEQEEAGSRASHIGTYVGERAVSCFITVNDCLYVRGPLTGQTQVNNNNQVWVLVLAIDLLFARVRVVQCNPDVPPPHCWSPSHHAPLVNSSPCWISISKLWDVTVCRQLPPTNPDEVAKGLYMVWITPMPSQHEALAVLSQLGDEDIESTVLAQTAVTAGKEGKSTKFKEYTPKEARLAAKKQAAQERAAAASRYAPPGTKSKVDGKVRLEAVRFYVDSVIVQWHLHLERSKSPDGSGLKKGGGEGVLEKKKVEPEFVVELTLTSEPTAWEAVYRGNGSACQISGLEPLTQYYCRITVVSHPKLSYSCVVVTTLGCPDPLAVPAITKWERGTAAGSLRGLVEVLTNKLPSGCFLQIEASLGDAESTDHHAAAEWIPAARTRSTKVWIVGPYSGKSVVLRTRVINQDGQPGPASQTGVARAPPVM